jgi:hypothetical protein
MRRLNTGFALHFNQRHNRIGYLFQDRFRSRLVGDTEDLRILLRYVLLNPLRGGLVGSLRDLERHPWCGYAPLLGLRPPHPFESVGRALALFGDAPVEARRRLRSWMSMGIASPDVERDDAGAPPASSMPSEDPAAAPSIRARGHGSLDPLIGVVCRHFCVTSEELARGARSDRVSRARAVVAFFAVVVWQIPASRVAGRLGVSTQAVCQALGRGARVAREEDLSPPREET